MAELYLNEVSQHSNEERAEYEESQSPIQQGSTSELIQKETNLLIEENIKSTIQIQQLLNNLSESTRTVEAQRNEILQLQTKFEGITELYKLEISKREEVDEKISYMKHISEASIKELNTLIQRANNIEKDKEQLDRIIANFTERTHSIGDIVVSINDKSTKMIQDLEEQLSILKSKNDRDQITIDKGQTENEHLQLKIKDLEQNLEQLIQQLNENKKIADEQIENCRAKLAETESMLQEALHEKLIISTQFEEIAKSLATQIDNAIQLNATIAQLTTENQDFQNYNEKLSNEIANAKEMEKTLIEDLRNLQVRFDEVDLDNQNSSKLLKEKRKIIEDQTVEINNNLQVINDLNHNLNAKDTLIDQLTKQIDQLQNEIDNLKSQIQDHQNILQQKSIEFENISKQLNNDIEAEKLKNESINKENMDLQQELSQYKEMHDTVIHEYRDTLQINETEFTKKIEELTNKYNEIKKDTSVQIDGKQKEIDQLHVDVNQMRTQINEYVKEMKILQEKLDAANKDSEYNEKEFINIPTQSEDDLDSTPNNEIMMTSTPKKDLAGNSDTDSSQASFRFDTGLFSRRTTPFSQQFGTKRKNPMESPINKRINNKGNIFSIPDSSSTGEKKTKETKKNVVVGNRSFRSSK